MVRNGYLPKRSVQTDVGDVAVRLPNSMRPKAKAALIGIHQS